MYTVKSPDSCSASSLKGLLPLLVTCVVLGTVGMAPAFAQGKRAPAKTRPMLWEKKRSTYQPRLFDLETGHSLPSASDTPLGQSSHSHSSSKNGIATATTRKRSVLRNTLRFSRQWQQERTEQSNFGHSRYSTSSDSPFRSPFASSRFANP